MADDLERSNLPRTSIREPDSRLAVVAHSLLGDVGAVRGAMQLAMAEPLEGNAHTLLELAIRRLDLMTTHIRDLAIGLPDEALTFLDDLGPALPAELDIREGTHVEVHSSFNDTWIGGFEIAEPVSGGYHVRRVSDGSLLAGVVASAEVRAVPHPSSPRTRRP